ncbi:YheU family protein [Bacterioplanoides sp.]|uniref:YheU family protein n=1 Tax=Bacterioplanoides sp. TaxID=2066072 RepID=UPI003B59C6F3
MPADYTSNPNTDELPSHMEDAPEQGVIAVPYQRLSADALDAILEDYVGREGTDYGDYNFSLSDKKAQVLAQLKSGQATLLFDPVQQTCHIEMTEFLRQQGWQG